MDDSRGSLKVRDGGWLRKPRRRRFRTISGVATLVASVAACVLTPAALASVPASGSGAPPHPMGLVAQPEPAPDAHALAMIGAAASSLPASVDLTPNAMPVGNQGQVGSCAAWATDYGALGYWENVEKLKGGGLEPMFTYAQYVNAYNGGQDRGSTIDYHLYVASQQGVDTQSDYSQGNFDYRDLPTDAERLNAVNWWLSSYSDLPLQQSASSTASRQSIEGALAAGNPVVIGIPVYWSFEVVGSANNGYYSGPTSNDPFLGYHAIVALGYNSQGLVIQNSWGTSWGKAGYATLSWSFVNQYVFQATSVGRLVTGQPANTAAPSISGTAVKGMTLTATPGTWSPTATSYAYQWERASAGGNAWSVISGATNATYVPVSADVGDNLRVVVTATNSAGKGAAASVSLAPVATPSPVNVVAPAISGSPIQGLVLTASNGTWSPAATSYTYQWQRLASGSSTWAGISGATAATYTPGRDDLGARLRAVIAAGNSYGQTSATSAAVGPVASGAPIDKVAPAITGTLTEGRTVSATTGTWTPAGMTYAYQWQRLISGQWANLSGVTGPTYQLEPSNVGTSVRVQVTATNAYGSALAQSAATGVVQTGAPINTAAPIVSGSAVRGASLRATYGTWANPGSAYSYQWQRSGDGSTSWTNIAGATASTYTLVSADEGHRLRVQVTTANQWGSLTASSAATSTIAASRPANSVAPKVTGAVTLGATLTATAGTWSGNGNTYSYRWQRNTSKGYVPIDGATSSTYRITSADQGVAVRVVVTAVNPDGSVSQSSNSVSAPAARNAAAVRRSAAGRHATAERSHASSPR